MVVAQTSALVRPAWPMEALPQSKTQLSSEDFHLQVPLRAPLQAQKITIFTGAKQSASGSGQREIIKLALNGDVDALSALFASNRVRLYRTAFSLLRNKEDAEDALQDGLLSAYVNLHSFEGRAQFSTWITRIVLNAALMSRRKGRALSQISLNDAAAENQQIPDSWPMSASLTPEQTYGLIETVELLEKEVRHLPRDLRSALQDSENEYAGVNKNTAKSRVSRARQRLALQFANKGVELRNCCF
jgi:RNA polymerase sigma-70 factor (ECF subfamily)